MMQTNLFPLISQLHKLRRRKRNLMVNKQGNIVICNFVKINWAQKLKHILHTHANISFLHILEPWHVPEMIKDLMVHNNHNSTDFITNNLSNRSVQEWSNYTNIRPIEDQNHNKTFCSDTSLITHAENLKIHHHMITHLNQVNLIFKHWRNFPSQPL